MSKTPRAKAIKGGQLDFEKLPAPKPGEIVTLRRASGEVERYKIMSPGSETTWISPRASMRLRSVSDLLR